MANDSNTPDSQSAATTSRQSLTMEELGELSEDIDSYMYWAQVWHRQAGGYTASDTAQTILRMERWARRLAQLTGKPETQLRKNPDGQDAS